MAYSLTGNYSWTTGQSVSGRCPYVKHHLISSMRYRKHLDNCRRADQINRMSNNRAVDVFPCKFCQELCFAPELIFHESRCHKREQLVKNAARLPAIADLDYDREITEMFRGVELGVTKGAFQGCLTKNEEPHNAAGGSGAPNQEANCKRTSDLDKKEAASQDDANHEIDEDSDSEAYWNPPPKPTVRKNLLLEFLNRIR